MLLGGEISPSFGYTGPSSPTSPSALCTQLSASPPELSYVHRPGVMAANPAGPGLASQCPPFPPRHVYSEVKIKPLCSERLSPQQVHNDPQQVHDDPRAQSYACPLISKIPLESITWE